MFRANDRDRIGSGWSGFADVRLRVPGGFGLAIVRHGESVVHESNLVTIERSHPVEFVSGAPAPLLSRKEFRNQDDQRSFARRFGKVVRLGHFSS